MLFIFFNLLDIANPNIFDILRMVETPVIVFIVVYGFQMVFKAWREDSRAFQQNVADTKETFIKLFGEAQVERREMLKSLDQITTALIETRNETHQTKECVEELKRSHEQLRAMFTRTSA